MSQMFKGGSVKMLAIVAWAFSFYFFSHLFEASRSFSYLSEMEREMNFRTEQGFYYSFFKETVNSDSVNSAFAVLSNDKTSEYGSVINAFERFNIYPEFLVGITYTRFHWLLKLMNVTMKDCIEIERGDDLSPIVTCIGLDEPIYFYLSCVWLLAGMTAATLMVYGSFLSESTLGGVIVVVCYFFNFAEATRVQWAPALRETFGYPFILLQMYFVTRILHTRDQPSGFHLKMMFFTTMAATLFWQFSQFIWLTQVLLLFGIVLLFGGYSVIRRLMLVHLLSLVACVCLLFGNRLLLTSPYSMVLIGCSMALAPPLYKPGFRNDFMRCSVATLTCVSLRAMSSFIFGSGDASHLWSILLSKFTNYRDFDSMLYTCTAEFDFLPVSTIRNLSETLLLPAAYLAVLLLMYSFWKTLGGDNRQKQDTEEAENSEYLMNLDLGLVYTVLQTIVFLMMALLIMRLKLFMTPGLCLLTSLLASRKICGFLPKYFHWSLLALLVAAMSVQGIANIKHEYYSTGEYSNPNQEELFNWVKEHTSTEHSFAGAMSIMANLKLSTGRAIVNHPHYESTGMRLRTKTIYQAFGRGSKETYAGELRRMLVDFLVVDGLHCYSKMRPGCGIIDLIEIDQKSSDLPVICEEFFEGDPSPFAVVFQNDAYVVLKVPEEW